MSAMTDDVTELDAREIDGEPFDAIMSALDDLAHGETLRLINSFEPEPLYGVLDQRGFAYETSRVGEEEWHVAIEPA
ncbi:MAG: DUF2249 domain-containing protein [Haloferacaceae archaeon]